MVWSSIGISPIQVAINPKIPQQERRTRMRLSKIDLTNLVAIGYADGDLGLLIDRGNEIEYVEIPAPIAAYFGLQQIDVLAASESASLSAPIEPTQLPRHKPLTMLPVNSSMALTVGYDHLCQILQVEFNSGLVYQYEAVEPETWESLQTADSTGRFFNSEIKGNYQCRRVE